MKKLNLKTAEILAAYNVLNGAKFGSMDDADKVKVWKIARALKPVATKFEEDDRDAREKLKPEVEGGFDETLVKAQEYFKLLSDKGDMSKAPMGAAQYDAFIKQLNEYNKLVDGAIEEFATKEVELSFEPLSEEAFGKLMTSNPDWKMAQVMLLDGIINE